MKIALLYKMHLPPALPLSELAELANLDEDTYDVVESAGIKILLCRGFFRFS